MWHHKRYLCGWWCHRKHPKTFLGQPIPAFSPFLELQEGIGLDVLCTKLLGDPNVKHLSIQPPVLYVKWKLAGTSIELDGGMSKAPNFTAQFSFTEN